MTNPVGWKGPRWTFSGASDDLTQVQVGQLGTLETQVEEVMGQHVAYILAGAEEGGKVRVDVMYLENGCWTVAVGLFDEDTPFPACDAIDIDIDTDPARGYSVATQVRCLYETEESGMRELELELVEVKVVKR